MTRPTPRALRFSLAVGTCAREPAPPLSGSLGAYLHRTPAPPPVDHRATTDETEARGLVACAREGLVSLVAARRLAARIRTAEHRRTALEGLDDLERRETHGVRLVAMDGGAL